MEYRRRIDRDVIEGAKAMAIATDAGLEYLKEMAAKAET